MLFGYDIKDSDKTMSLSRDRNMVDTTQVGLIHIYCIPKGGLIHIYINISIHNISLHLCISVSLNLCFFLYLLIFNVHCAGGGVPDSHGAGGGGGWGGESAGAD